MKMTTTDSRRVLALSRRANLMLLTLEDDSLPLAGLALRLLQAVASNIRLYVCRKPDRTRACSRAVLDQGSDSLRWP